MQKVSLVLRKTVFYKHTVFGSHPQGLFAGPGGAAGARPVTLRTDDVLGRVVATLVEGEQRAGEYRVFVDAGGPAGGTNFSSLYTVTGSVMRKMLRVRVHAKGLSDAAYRPWLVRTSSAGSYPCCLSRRVIPSYVSPASSGERARIQRYSREGPPTTA